MNHVDEGEKADAYTFDIVNFTFVYQCCVNAGVVIRQLWKKAY